MRIAAALVAVGTTALLAIALARRGRRPWLALGYGLSPAVAVEAANNGHVELVATLLVVAAAMTVRRRLLSGVLLGLAVAVKVVPLLLLPALRTGLRCRLGTATTVLASYLPHLLVTGWLVLGYLPGYLGEEGFDRGHDRYAVLAVLLPEPAWAPIALLAGVVLAALAWYRTPRDGAAVTATWLFGAAMLIGTPSYPWYTLPLLGLAVLAGRWEWLAVVVSAYGAYAAYDDPGRIRAWYVAAAIVVLAVTAWRHLGEPGRVRHRRPRHPSQRPHRAVLTGSASNPRHRSSGTTPAGAPPRTSHRPVALATSIAACPRAVISPAAVSLRARSRFTALHVLRGPRGVNRW